MKWLSELVDKSSEFFAHRKGLLPIIGMGLIIVNLLLQIFPDLWLTQSNLFLHIGLLVAILGIMLSWAL